ncbi:MAG TPA: WYL domain-containing transcriptional regulator [Caldilineaceae bacterium]|nr:WYL domain-containing transcriptional regulator [Caldilineaceae bacterium]
MSRAQNKAARLGQIEALLLMHQEGLIPAEIARKLEVHRSTILRCLPDLPKHIYVDDLDEGRWKVDRSNYLVQVRLTLHESMAVHLAARLLATRMDKKNPHAAAALRKLGVSLERLAPRISEHLARSADVMDDEAQRHDPRYLVVLETLTLAWAEARRVKLWHRGKDNRISEYDFAPYFIEPYAVGQTTHVLGVHGPKDKRITFKLERIERIEATREPYTLPAGYDPREQLGDAWGIWYTDGKPVDVVLKFHPRVARRVRETRWHRNETVTEEPDGYLIWETKVAEPQEMLPWIRGWGADVEVIEPNDLRLEIARETRRLMILYGFEQLADGEQDDSNYDQRRASQLFRKR